MQRSRIKIRYIDEDGTIYVWIEFVILFLCWVSLLVYYFDVDKESSSIKISSWRSGNGKQLNDQHFLHMIDNSSCIGVIIPSFPCVTQKKRWPSLDRLFDYYFGSNESASDVSTYIEIECIHIEYSHIEAEDQNKVEKNNAGWGACPPPQHEKF